MKSLKIIIGSVSFGFILILIFIGIELINFIPDPSPPLDGNLTEVNKKCLDLLIDSTKLFMTWSIALIGVLAYFIRFGFEKRVQFSKMEIFFGGGAIVLSLFSLFFGHLIIEYLIEMLSFDIFNPLDSVLIWYIRLHYFAFLFSLIFLVSYLNYFYFKKASDN